MFPRKDGLKKKQLIGIVMILSMLLGLFVWQNGRFLRADTNFPQYLPFIAREEDGEVTATSTIQVTWTTLVVPTRTPTPTGTATPTPPSTPSPTASATPTLIPTSTATASFTPTLTPTPAVTASATPTFTPTSTPTPSATPILEPCGAFFIGAPIAGTTYALVTGVIDTTVNLFNLTTGLLIGTDTFIEGSGFSACPGVASFSGLLQPLIAGHVLLAVPSVGNPATAIVVPPTPFPGVCGVYFEYEPMAGAHFVWVTGEVGTTVAIYNLTTGELLGSDTFLPLPGHLCAGFADFSGNNAFLEPLQEGHVLLAVPGIGHVATAVVVVYTPTPTPTVIGKGK